MIANNAFIDESPYYNKRGWNKFAAGYGKRGWNNFAAGYGKRAGYQEVSAIIDLIY